MVEKYINLSLDDKRIGKVAEILSNKTCKKILNYLAENDASESEISEHLKMPLNTVGYNIKKLRNEGLIKEKSHFWSLRGKRIPVYRVSDKKIIITPRSSIKDKLKSSLPVVLVSGIFTFFLLWYSRSVEKSEMLAAERAVDIMVETEAIRTIPTFRILDYFLIIMWIGIVIFVAINMRRSK